MIIALPTQSPAGHGAIRHAERLRQLLERRGVDVTRGDEGDVIHVQFTDALWGSDVASAADHFVRWVDNRRLPVVITAHDIPGSDADPQRDQRRAAAYTRALSACTAVVVCSEAERRKASTLTSRPVHFIELPLPLTAPDRRPGPTQVDRPPVLGVAGFIYPGKGHDQVIAAAARCPARPTVRAIGTVAPGHGALREELEQLARSTGVRFEVTGELDDPAWAQQLGAVDVPIMSNVDPSASASLLAWVGIGRRPIAALGSYTAELLARHPGLFHPYGRLEELDAEIGAALTEPGRSYRSSPPPWPDVAERHVDMYRRVLR